ncbi:hypothetical protein PDIDSM_2983 [Penicillium digitatum]|nr:hypothetical protein PDIDSM_2983 [Penicillium digitatum]
MKKNGIFRYRPEQSSQAQIPCQYPRSSHLFGRTRASGLQLRNGNSYLEYWTNWPPGEPKRETDDVYHGMPFMDIVQGYIDNSPDTCEDNDAEWFRCFNLYGIHRELQEVIMDPKFRYIRLTESCKFWVLDTFQLRNRALQTAQDASRERDMARRREASRSRQSSSVGSGQRSISDSLRVVMPWLSRETALSEAAATAASRKPGHTTLYKRIDQARASV